MHASTGHTSTYICIPPRPLSKTIVKVHMQLLSPDASAPIVEKHSLWKSKQVSCSLSLAMLHVAINLRHACITDARRAARSRSSARTRSFRSPRASSLIVSSTLAKRPAMPRIHSATAVQFISGLWSAKGWQACDATIGGLAVTVKLMLWSFVPYCSY